jgi:mRNA-degrading endonuclease RelE of RelBE toxin-antitoxin system
MEVKFAKLFEKDLKAISEKQVILKVDEIITLLNKAKNLQDLTGIKKLKGHKDCYRLRIGSYRLGLQVEKDTVWLARLMLRKDIYKYFP